MKRTLTALLFVTAPILAATPAFASVSSETLKSIPKSTLDAGCKQAGGTSSGSTRGGAWGCSVVHKDGSADTVVCNSTKCTHYHIT